MTRSEKKKKKKKNKKDVKSECIIHDLVVFYTMISYTKSKFNI
jgi:hypothetical protein